VNANGQMQYAPCSNFTEYQSIMKVLEPKQFKRKYYDFDPTENVFDIEANINDNVYEGFLYKFQIGKAEVRKEGSSATIISCGIMTIEAEKATKILEEKGISVSHLNMATIKPLDKDALLKEAKKTGLFVVCEEHNVIGGLGSAISEFISETHPIPILKVGMKDEFGKSGTWQELMQYFHMTDRDIVLAVEKGLELKK
jgi:transketolase